MIAALAALLDRSVARIVEVSADGRYFDREQVATIAGIGDNNSVPCSAPWPGGPGGNGSAEPGTHCTGWPTSARTAAPE